MTIIKKEFGKLPDGRVASIYQLTNENGASAHITDFGGAVVRLYMPNRNGQFDDVVCGYDNIDSYVNGDGYQGALIGRHGNRIANGRFELDGKEYVLNCNDNKVNHLHGGNCGFSHRLWDATVEDDALKLHLVSEDGDEGYPGCIDVTVRYRLTCENGGDALEIDYTATSDKKTIINLTNHTYFNLGGYASGNVYTHKLVVDADSYLPTTEKLIPTGEVKFVGGTPFDFSGKSIGQDINADNKDIKIAGGYDHCFVFNGGKVEYSNNPPCRCELYHEESGRHMYVLTDRPCVQVYSANFMYNPEFPFKGGVKQSKQNAICLETQSAPDAINQPSFAGFSDCILDAGEVFRSKTIYHFVCDGK